MAANSRLYLIDIIDFQGAHRPRHSEAAVPSPRI